MVRPFAHACGLLAITVAAAGKCHRSPLCSCCDYPRAAALAAREPQLPGSATGLELATALGPALSFASVKAACSKWVHQHRGFLSYICHISDATDGHYRAFAYASNGEINVREHDRRTCKSAFGAPMRTSVVFTCVNDPPSPPPAPPSPPPGGSTHVHLATAADPLPADEDAEGGGSVAGAFVSLIVVVLVFGCLAIGGVLASRAVLGGDELDLERTFQPVLDALQPALQLLQPYIDHLTQAVRGTDAGAYGQGGGGGPDSFGIHDDDDEDDERRWAIEPEAEPPSVFYGPEPPPPAAQPTGSTMMDEIDEDY